MSCRCCTVPIVSHIIPQSYQTSNCHELQLYVVLYQQSVTLYLRVTKHQTVMSCSCCTIPSQSHYTVELPNIKQSCVVGVVLYQQSVTLYRRVTKHQTVMSCSCCTIPLVSHIIPQSYQASNSHELQLLCCSNSQSHYTVELPNIKLP